MSEMGGSVQQQSRSVGSDGRTQNVTINRGGDLTIAQQYDRWLREGRVFEAHFATPSGTATIEINTTYDLTEPFFRFTVPSSIVVVPIRVLVTPTTVWVTTDGITIGTSDTDTYTSGGAAPVVKNMAAVSSLDSALKTSSVTNIYDGDSVLTEAALTNPRILDAKVFRTGGLFVPYEYNILKGDPATMIHGPSSFWCNAMLAGAFEVQYSVMWAELDKAELVNS